jgi:hypothetical protein
VATREEDRGTLRRSGKERLGQDSRTGRWIVASVPPGARPTSREQRRPEVVGWGSTAVTSADRQNAETWREQCERLPASSGYAGGRRDDLFL